MAEDTLRVTPGLASLRPGPAMPLRYEDLYASVRLEAAASSWVLHVSYLDRYLSQDLGDLSSPYPTPPERIAAELWDNAAGPGIVRALVHTAPFWVEGDTLFSQAQDGPAGYLLRYRLSEIALAALNQAPEPLREQELIRVLLLRQRFRYLAALADWQNLRHVFAGRASFAQHLREARFALAQALLDQPARAELAFELAELPAEGVWDMEAEIRSLVFHGPSLATRDVAVDTAGDRQLTDTIIRRGFLARNNLLDASRAVGGLIDRAGGGRSSWLARALPYFHGWFIGWTLLAAGAFWLAGMGRLDGWRWVFLPAVLAAVAVPMVFWAVVWSKQGLQRAAIYPLALRVPGLALLGLSVAFGLSGYLPYAFNAWDQPAVGWFVFLVSPAITFFYITFETLARVNQRRAAAGRAAWLTAYLWATTFWLALLVGWFAEPVGMMDCQIGRAGCSASGVIELTRSVDFMGGRVSTDFVFFVGALSLLVGLLTQLFWEDRSVAEPL